MRRSVEPSSSRLRSAGAVMRKSPTRPTARPLVSDGVPIGGGRLRPLDNPGCRCAGDSVIGSKNATTIDQGHEFATWSPRPVGSPTPSCGSPQEGMVRNGLPDVCAEPPRQRHVLRDALKHAVTTLRGEGASSEVPSLRVRATPRCRLGSLQMRALRSVSCRLRFAGSISATATVAAVLQVRLPVKREASVRVRPRRKRRSLFGAVGGARTHPRTRSPGKQRATLCWQRQSVRYGFVSGAKP